MGSPDLVETTLLAHIQAIELTRATRDPETISDAILRALMRLADHDPKYAKIAEYYISKCSPEIFDLPETLRGGEFTLERPERKLVSPKFTTDEPRILKPLQSKIFERLLFNLGNAVSNQRLVGFAWGMEYEASGGQGMLLKTHICHLRAVVDHPGIVIDGRPARSHIQSVNRYGYRLSSCDEY